MTVRGCRSRLVLRSTISVEKLDMPVLQVPDRQLPGYSKARPAALKLVVATVPPLGAGVGCTPLASR